jgi:hypothetical protein
VSYSIVEACEDLRKINRPDAAQRIENWSEEDWVRLSHVGASKETVNNFSYQGLSNFLWQSFLWDKTAEGEGYWCDLVSSPEVTRITQERCMALWTARDV